MMNAAWKGIYPAMLTPLEQDETLDERACADLTGRLLDGGAAGLYVTGSTGEWFGIDDETRREVYRVSVAAARGRGRIIAHVGGVPTKRAARLARSAADFGADAVSAVPPPGDRLSAAELCSYYECIASECGLPLFAYHVPHRTGYALDHSGLSAVLETPGVEGMKYTDEDMYVLERLTSRFPEKTFFMGDDEMLLCGFCAGAGGAIGTTYNLTLPLARAILDAFERGDLDAARAAQRALNGFIEEIRKLPSPLRAVKALAAETYGWTSNASPSPGHVPSTDEIRGARLALERAMA
jgi:N-acetylneuraminate lyase